MPVRLREKLLLILFGCVLALVLLKITLGLGGWVYLKRIDQRNKLSLARYPQSFRIMCLGESTTAEGAWGSYPRQLGRILRKRLPHQKFSIINKGVPGVSSSYILTQLPANIRKYKPDMIIVMMGINDDEEEFVSYSTGIAKVKAALRKIAFHNLTKFLAMNLKERRILQDIYLERAGYWRSKEDFPRAEKLFRKAIETDPKNEECYLEFGRYYRELWNYSAAEAMFKKAIEARKGYIDAYLELARTYLDAQDYRAAEETLRSAIEISPQQASFYIELAKIYGLLRDDRQAELCYEKAIAVEPDTSEPYLGLAELYQKKKEYPRAQAMLARVEEVASNNKGDYIRLAWAYYFQGKYDDAERIFEKALMASPSSYEVFLESGRYYLKRYAYEKAEEMFLKAIGLDPHWEAGYISLGWCYNFCGRFQEANEMFVQALKLSPNVDLSYDELKRYYDNNAQNTAQQSSYMDNLSLIFKKRDAYYEHTAVHYKELKEIVLRHKIQLVCVQYPRRSIAPLKRLFGADTQIILVDNEEAFNKAVAAGTYVDYFEDRFAGDFGHCTPLGNRLLAENIADTLLRQYFNNKDGRDVATHQ